MLSIILVLALIALLTFLLFVLIRGTNVFGIKPLAMQQQQQEQEQPIPFRASFEEKVVEDYEKAALQKSMEVQAVNEEPVVNEDHSEIVENNTQAPVQETPVVAGQSEQELKAPEPLQESISTKFETNAPLDTYEKNDNIAMFGSNLRHPEASFDKFSPGFSSLETEVASGVASRNSVPSDMDKVRFSAEMAQNGGEFMSGIFAYDNTDEGSYFSSL